jgi:Leucine-rich repeat (LRR) protein
MRQVEITDLSQLADVSSDVEKLTLNELQLTSLPDFSRFTQLKKLEVNHNQIKKITSLPSTLKSFTCYDSQLEQIDEFPSSLLSIHLFINQLTTLPPLPPNLVILDVYNNQLTSLPPLPSTLQKLFVEHNFLTTLPPLPYGITHIYCSQNQLKEIPNLPSTVKELCCTHNQLTSIPIYHTKDLQYLRCRNNQLTLVTQDDIETFMPFKKWWYEKKFGLKLERIVMKRRNNKFKEEYQHVLYSPEYNFYKRFLTTKHLFV